MRYAVIIDGVNTFTTWGLVPTSRPVVNPPEVKTHYIELPAANGYIDLTEFLMGEPPMGQRTGSWEFYLRPEKNWASVYAAIKSAVHGKKCRVTLADDPSYFYEGRLAVNEWRSDAANSLLTLDYNFNPLKQTLTKSDDNDWLWDDVFEQENYVIIYGNYNVNGRKDINLINEGNYATTPVYTVSAPMQLALNGVYYDLVAGDNYNENLTLQPGDNVMTFFGTGTVNVSYRGTSL